MATQQAKWRVNDVVAYDLMRELASSVQAHLIDQIRRGDTSARNELLQTRRGTLAVNGYDRAAVDAHTQQLQQRDTELAAAATHGS
jgi:hypothetical protein